MSDVDAVVVGAGPNGLAAAITLAERGLAVRVYEAASTPGGGMRTAELTLPGFAHDICSTVQGLALISPFMRTLDLDALGVRMRTPEIAYAHPLDGGRAALLYPDVARTAEGLRSPDGETFRKLFEPLVRDADKIWPDALGALRSIPRHPIALARFGLPSLRSVQSLAGRFLGDEGQALIAGAGAHSMRRLDAPLTGAFALVLALSALVTGWPVVEGGSDGLTRALVARLAELGGEVVCDSPITSLSELPAAKATLLDVTPAQFAAMAGDRLDGRYARSTRKYPYGPGVFKMDWALSGPVPWTAPGVAQAGTVHIGGDLAELSRSEADAEAGRHSDSPYVLLVQASVMDPTRAPAGQHALWAYCHVPHGSTVDMSEAIERQIERFAPGFRDLILARATRNSVEYEAYDGNYVGGDINGGVASLRQITVGPVAQWSRYSTPIDGVYLCSSSTAPGGGVHGQCGALAAREALRKHF
ncbi:MAG: FAD-dependent oxidoreductase [Pseudonocardiales bacterium]|nr:FAD-dependent oxidoreductase [Pseudonocardiales bacterium]